MEPKGKEQEREKEKNKISECMNLLVFEELD